MCICILHRQLFNKIPIGIHTSLSPRPELLIGTDDNLPAHDGNFLQDLGPEGGQGVLRLFIDLYLKFAGLQSGELGDQISFYQWLFRWAFSQPG
jgi:hypothetical protein